MFTTDKRIAKYFLIMFLMLIAFLVFGVMNAPKAWANPLYLDFNNTTEDVEPSYNTISNLSITTELKDETGEVVPGLSVELSGWLKSSDKNQEVWNQGKLVFSFCRQKRC